MEKAKSDTLDAVTRAITEAIRESGGWAPSGYVYLGLQAAGVDLSLDGYHALVQTLVLAGQLRREGDILFTTEAAPAPEEQAKRQAECEVAYDGNAEGFVPLKVKPAKDGFAPELMDAMRDCRGGALFGMPESKRRQLDGFERNRACTGCHVNYHESERPKLTGKSSKEVLKRVLATPMWKGSRVEEADRAVICFVTKQLKGFSHPVTVKEREVHRCYVLTHPSGAVMVLRADLA